MKIFISEKIKELDKYTIQKEPILSIDLMERAASVFTETFVSEFKDFSEIFVFAGPGNNGGDALAIARLLYHRGFRVKAYLFNPQNNLSENCENNKCQLSRLSGIKFVEVKNSFTPPEIKNGDIVIDGLFGSGLNRPLEGGFASVVRFINHSAGKVVSIDIPSGLFGEDNTDNQEENIICADYTFTFQFPKLSFFFTENEKYTGCLKILNIGLHPEGVEEIPTEFNLLEKSGIKSLMKKRSPFAHKGNFGHALLIAGGLGKMGAAILSAKACLKAGAGLVSVHLPQSGNSILQSSFPEAMTHSDKNEFIVTGFPELHPYNAIAAGPGIGTDPLTAQALRDLCTQSDKQLILDADALNIMASDKSFLEIIPPGTILTPHPKEFDRLAGTSASSYERLLKAMDFAVDTQTFVILKGHYSAVCTPNRNCFFNSTGNSGMATAGCGDVLTGILLGLSAQGYTTLETCQLGVYIHGLSGDLALVRESEESLLAGEIIRFLGESFKEIRY